MTAPFVVINAVREKLKEGHMIEPGKKSFL